MVAQRSDRGSHVGKQWQLTYMLMERGVVGDVEDANVLVGSGNAPQVTPSTIALQPLRHGFLLTLELGCCIGGHVEW